MEIRQKYLMYIFNAMIKDKKMLYPIKMLYLILDIKKKHKQPPKSYI